MMTSTIGKLLTDAGLINDKQLQQAMEMHKKEGGLFESILLSQKMITEAQLLPLLSKHYHVMHIILSSMDIEPKVTKLIPLEIIQKYKLVPFGRKGIKLKVAMVDPANISAIDDIKFMTGFEIEPYVTSEKEIIGAINKYYDAAHSLQTVMDSFEDDADLDILQDGEEDINESQVKEEAEEAPVVKLVNLILMEAIKKKVSDIHIEPYEKKFRVRYRLDGTLTEVMTPPLRLKKALTSRLKIMADLDISERRLPQDGRIKLKMKNKEVDIRVSTLPCLFGEKIVMRILDKENLNLDMEKLGFLPEQITVFLKAIQSPWGMVLVTGPTGSGKTTTLYSAMSYINHDDINIMTAEDPVEYNLYGINQVHMKSSIGLTFATALRAFLRQDPDVVMVGEMRDLETAEIGVKAALTGHLVLSTLHTNDAPSTINRLLNMGVEPFNVASSIILILAQRLIRQLCKACKKPADIPEQALLDIGFKKEEISKVEYHTKTGCDICSNTGFKGRIALYEIMPVNESLRNLILKSAPADEIKKHALQNGMISLRSSGLRQIKTGNTTIEEVTSATFAD